MTRFPLTRGREDAASEQNADVLFTFRLEIVMNLPVLQRVIEQYCSCLVD